MCALPTTPTTRPVARKEPTAPRVPTEGQYSVQQHKPYGSPQSQNDEYSQNVQNVQELESRYERAVRELRAEINNRGHDSWLRSCAQDVLNDVVKYL